MKNIVLTAAFGLDLNQVELFIKSLRTYYNQQICLVIGKKDKDLIKKLESYKCDFVVADFHKHEIQSRRYEIFLEFLNKKECDQVLCCDCRDIYFQSDPFNESFKGEINFFLEDKKIGDCTFNSNWIEKTYGKNILNSLANETILCSGTVIANHTKMKEYLKTIIKQIKENKYKKKMKYLLTFRRDKSGRGCDQGHANYIAHKKLINGTYFYKNSTGPIATVFHLKKIKFNNDNYLINDLGKPYSIVHQYDKRWSEFENSVNIIKKKLNIVA